MAASDAKPVPQKNVAYRVTFPILDADGDLVTGATGLDSEVSKDGGTFADCTNEATEIATSSGVYYLDLTSTEMNADTVAVIVKTSSSGAKTTVLVMYPEEAGDIRVNVTAYGGTAGTFSGGRPEVNTSHIAGSAVSTSSAQIGVNVVNAGGTAWASGSLTSGVFASGAITATAIAADAIGASELAADAIAEIADAVWDEDATAHQTGGTFGQAIGDPGADTNTIFAATVTNATGATVGHDTATLLARLGTPSDLGGGATVAANLSDIEAQTDDIGAAGAGLTAIPWNAAWDAEVQSEVQDALEVNQLDHLLAVALPAEFNTIVEVNSVVGYLAHNNVGTGTGTLEGGYNRTTDSLEAISLAIDALEAATAPTAAQIADAVWDEATAGHTTSGTFGEQLKTDVDAILEDTGTTLQAEVDGIQADTEDIQSRLPAALTAGGNIKADVLAISGDATAADNLEAEFDGTGYLYVRRNTAQSGLASSITLDASASASDDVYADSLITILSGTGAGQTRRITDYGGASKLAAISPDWFVNPSSDSVFLISPFSLVDVGHWRGTQPNALQSGRVDSYTGAMAAGVVTATVIATDAIDADALAASAVTEIQSGLSTLTAAQVQTECEDALQTYRLHTLVHTAITGEFHTAVHVNSVIGYLAHNNVGTGTGTVEGGYNRTTDSLESIALAVDALEASTAPTTTEIWSHATRTLTTLDEDSTTLDLDATIRAAVGMSSANLDTQLDALPTAAENAAAVLAAGDVDGYTLEQTLKLCLAALAGKLSGAATTTIVIRAADDSKDRITATVTENGDRTTVVLDATG